MCKKLAIILPGKGYHVDKPILYYTIDMLAMKGYECISMEYPAIMGEGRQDIKSYIKLAYTHVEEQIEKIEFDNYEDIIFVSKSMGSVIACQYIMKHQNNIRQIIYTPIQDTLSYEISNAIIFHGTNDNWCDTEDLKEYCKERNIALHLTNDGNHSLETEDVMLNIANLMKVMEKTERYINEIN